MGERMSLTNTMEYFNCDRYRAAYGQGDDARHTMMPLKGSAKAGCGKFVMSEEAMRAYYDAVVVRGQVCRLTEMQPCKDKATSGKLTIDLDFRQPKEIAARLFDDAFVESVCENVTSAIVVHCDVENRDYPDPLMFVSAKPAPNCTELADFNKDGIHIVVNADIPYSVRSDLRNTFIALCEKDKLFAPFANDIRDIVDATPFSGKTQWTTYGSRKDGQEPYLLTHTYSGGGELARAPKEPVSYETFQAMCARNHAAIAYEPNSPDKVQEFKRKFKLVNPTGRPKKKNARRADDDSETSSVGSSNSDEPKEDKLAEVIHAILDEKPDAFDEHIEWCKLGFIIAEELGDDGLTLFKEISLLTGSDTGKKHDETEQETQYAKHRPDAPTKLGIGTLFHMLKQLNPDHPLLKRPASKKELLNIICDDAEAADQVVTELNRLNVIRLCGDKVYVRVNKNWSTSKENIEFLVRQTILSLAFYVKVHLKDETKMLPFGRDTTDQTNVCKQVIRRAIPQYATRDDDFEKTLRFSARYYLPFVDCILDMRDGKAYDWDDLPDVYTRCAISYPIKDWWNSLTQEKTAQFNIRATLYEPVFGTNTDRALAFLSRAVAGCKDKRFLEHTASRNCGKSVLHASLMNAFGDLVTSFSINHLTKSGDDPKDFGWLVKIGDARLAINQEVENTKKINNSMLKKLVGGDEIDARELYSNGGNTKSIAMFASFGNESLQITKPGDSAETSIRFFQTKTFVEKAVYNKMPIQEREYCMIGDPEMVNKVNDLEFKRQHVWTIVREFQNNPEPVSLDINDQEADEVDETQHITLPNALREMFLFTKNSSDILLIQEVYNLCSNRGFGDHRCISKTLKERFNIIKIKSNATAHRNKYVFKGIVINPDYQCEDIQCDLDPVC